MQEITLGSRKMNRGEQIAAIVCGALLMYHATTLGIGLVWYIAVAIYVTILFLMLLRSQRFVLIHDSGIEYKPNPLGSPEEFLWTNIAKIISNSQGVTLHFNDGKTRGFTPEHSKWFNFRKFRMNVERYATALNIPVLISQAEVPVMPPSHKRLPE
ncbi:MAG: hypothetical protein EAZ92_05465 [Candidatus Kapaibacterium sp.]|nr:MAG: hypothetical protein EAZ92_05465 [Candidatus Kapabacteria bacterium]